MSSGDGAPFHISRFRATRLAARRRNTRRSGAMATGGGVSTTSRGRFGAPGIGSSVRSEERLELARHFGVLVVDRFQDVVHRELLELDALEGVDDFVERRVGQGAELLLGEPVAVELLLEAGPPPLLVLLEELLRGGLLPDRLGGDLPADLP